MYYIVDVDNTSPFIKVRRKVETVEGSDFVFYGSVPTHSVKKGIQNLRMCKHHQKYYAVSIYPTPVLSPDPLSTYFEGFKYSQLESGEYILWCSIRAEYLPKLTFGAMSPNIGIMITDTLSDIRAFMEGYGVRISYEQLETPNTGVALMASAQRKERERKARLICGDAGLDNIDPLYLPLFEGVDLIETYKTTTELDGHRSLAYDFQVVMDDGTRRTIRAGAVLRENGGV